MTTRPEGVSAHDPHPTLLTRREVASKLRVGLSTVAELTASGELPSLLIRRRRLYRPADVQAFIDRAAEQDGSPVPVGGAR